MTAAMSMRSSPCSRSARGSVAVWIRRAASSSPATRALCSRCTCTSRSSARFWRVASASVSTSSTPNSSIKPTAGVAASNSRRCVRNAPNARAAGSATAPSMSSAAPCGFQRGVANTSQPPSSRNSAASSIGAHAWRRSSVWSKRFSSSCAWISLPGIRSPTGVFWYSSRPSPVTPISTSFCCRLAGSIRPSRTSMAETKRWAMRRE